MIPMLLTGPDIVLVDMTITVRPARQTITIDPLPVRHHEFDGQLTIGETGWRGDLLLPKTAWVFRALRPGSLVITLAGHPDVKLIEGTDYFIDPDWGSLNAAPSSAYPPGTPLHFAHDYTLSRLDLVEQTSDGRLTVRKGLEDKDEPLLPRAAPGRRPLFSVYLRPNTTTLARDNINILDPAYDGVPPVTGAEYIEPAKTRLASGQPFTIVFFGDSITAQEPPDFRDGKGSFVDRFTSHLRMQHPDREIIVTPRETAVTPMPGQIVVVKAGVGGNDTREALARIEADVLARHPDLVVIMFGANDENRVITPEGRTDENNVPVAEYAANLTSIVSQVRSSGAEPILMTTGMKNLDWEGTAGNLDEYASAARALAASERVCLIDNFQAWQNLPKRGYNYMIYLSTCINHPNDLGHQLFFEGLRRAFARPVPR